MIEVFALTENVLTKNAAQLVVIEKSLNLQFGDLYSHERWNIHEFACQLKDKWRLSSVAFLDHKVVGFWVASQQFDGVAHTHRVGVLPECQNSGVGKRMWEFLDKEAKHLNINNITLTVRRENEAAIEFYRRLGFKIIVGQSLFDFLLARGREKNYRESYIEENSLAYLLLENKLNTMV